MEEKNCMDKQPNQKTEMEERKTVQINNQTRKQKWKEKN